MALVRLLLISLLYKVSNGNLIAYLNEANEILDCSDKCENSTFIPVLKKEDGSCPEKPEHVNLMDFLEFDDICNYEIQPMETVDAYDRPMGTQVTIFYLLMCLEKNPFFRLGVRSV